MRKKAILLVLLLLLSLIPLRDLAKPGVYFSHDFLEHAARLASFYKSLREGNLIPRWGGNLNYGYGHPALMFLYPLTNYLGSFFHFLGFSLVDSIKILFALSYIASGIFMFFWITQLWDAEAGFIAAIFYLFSPYRFVNLYVRAALGEHLAYTFAPLVCLFLTNLVKKKDKRYLFLSGFSIALLILAHNLLSLIFLIFIFLYCLYLIFLTRKERKSRFYLCLGSLISAFFLSAFFWIPALLEGKYTLMSWIPLKEQYFDHYISWKELFISKWGYGGAASGGKPSGFSVQIGWLHWLVFFWGSFFLFIKRKTARGFLLILLFYFLLGVFLTIRASSWLVHFLPFLVRFQFPWRFLAMPVFASSAIAGWLIYYLKAKYKLLLITILALSVILSTVRFWRIKGIDERYLDDGSIVGYATTGTTETGESTPKWAIRFQESYPPEKVQLVWGKLKNIKIEEWQFQYHKYKVTTSEDSQLADNTLYFPGWKVWVDGKQVPINFQDMNWRGIITYPVSVGEHQIVVKFTNTRIRFFSELLSLAAVGFIFVQFFPVPRARIGGGFLK